MLLSIYVWQPLICAPQCPLARAIEFAPLLVLSQHLRIISRARAIFSSFYWRQGFIRVIQLRRLRDTDTVESVQIFAGQRSAVRVISRFIQLSEDYWIKVVKVVRWIENWSLDKCRIDEGEGTFLQAVTRWSNASAALTVRMTGAGVLRFWKKFFHFLIDEEAYLLRTNRVLIILWMNINILHIKIYQVTQISYKFHCLTLRLGYDRK